MRLAILLFSLAIAWAQESSVVSLSNGIQLRVYARSADGAAIGLKTEIQPASGNSFYRMYRDENDLVVFAYELAVERTEDGMQFRATARPAGPEFAARFPNATGGKPTPTLPGPIESGMLDSGGRFAIDIPANPGLSPITDTVQIRINQRGGPPPEWGSQSSAQLRFVALKVSINGALASPSGAGAVVAGRFAMFYLPGQGGYFFSAEPVERRSFAQIGVVDGTRLRFTIEGDIFECDSEAQILLKSERGVAWVYHDPGYRPEGNWTKDDPREGTREQFFTAASDSLNWWLP
ncbi:MAG: hypothetical protein LAP38_28610 [Acidobacteriia bacterium]|nr:hypothetical protein [Terriglobia bacterium]